jgi:pilus assembly protein CpaB
LAIALLLCLAAGITVHQLTPPPSDTVSAFAAARDLPAGTALTASDLVDIPIPQRLVTTGSVANSTDAVGKQLAAPLRQGQLLTDSLLVGPGLLAGTPPGSAAVPLRMADPSSIQLVSPGQLVNVVLTGGNGYDQQSPSEVLASAVPVLWTSGHGGKTGQWLGSAETEGLIVVAAGPEQAARLAGASTQGKLFFVLVGAQGAGG